MIKQATVHEINELLDTGGECQVIDVREFSEFNSERIADAQFMPLSNFEKHEAEIDHTKPVYLMCRSGNRANQAAERLMKKGFTDIHVIQADDGGVVGSKPAYRKGGSTVWSLERQVRFAAGLFVVAGILLSVFLSPYVIVVSALVGAGLTSAATVHAMGMILARMPWNRRSCCV